MGTHMPYGITQCYLPPRRADIPAFTPAKQAGTRFSDPGVMQGCVDLVGWLHTEMVHHPKMVTHPSPNRARRRAVLFLAKQCVDRSTTGLSLSSAMSMEQAADRAEAAVIDQYFLLPAENISFPVSL